MFVPENLAAALGKALGSFAWRIIRFRRNLVLENLAWAFPEKVPDELVRIGLACYRNLGVNFILDFRLHRLPTSWMEGRISSQGRELLDRALAQGRGVIDVSFHYGNWELMGAYYSRLGYPIDDIVRAQKNPYFDRYVSALRQANGMRLLPVTGSPKLVLRSLQAGRIVSFLADQDAHLAGVFVDFLGRPASTPRGPALYAFKTGAPVVLSIMVPAGPDSWKIIFEPVPHPETGDREEFISQMTAYFTDRLAEYVRRVPEHYFWPHRRWKTRKPE